MLVQIKKTIETTVELSLPAYFKNGSYFFKITEDSAYKVGNGFCIIYEKEDWFFDNEIKKIVTDAEPSDEASYNEMSEKLICQLQQLQTA